MRKYSRTSITLSLAIVFSMCILTNCADAQITGLSTDSGVLTELQKILDAKSAALAKGDDKLEAKQKAASKLEAKDVCIQRLKESARIIVIGFFRTDIGCQFDGAFIDSRFFGQNDFDLSKNALAALGWKTADREKRETLAGIWVEKGLLAFSDEHYERFKNPVSSRYASTTDGEIKVIMLLPSIPGRTTRGYARKVFTFNKDGDLLSAIDGNLNED